MGNRLFLRARGWGIDCQVRTKLQIPGLCPGGMVTGRIEPCITGYRTYSKPHSFITRAFLAQDFISISSESYAEFSEPRQPYEIMQ